MPPANPAIYVARPAVRIDGRDRPRVADLLVGLTMTERDGGMSALELRLTNYATDTSGSADFVFQGDEAIDLGASIEVDMGDSSAQQTVFKGHITGLESELAEGEAPRLVVLAEDPFQQARMSRRTEVHDSATISSLASTIAGKLGLSADASRVSDEAATQVQLNESDLAFLRRMLDRHDCDMQVIDGKLAIAPRADRQRARLRLTMNRELRRARVLVDLAHQVSTVTVTGWDETQGQRVSASSTGSNFGPGSGVRGPDVLSQTLGDRAEHVGHLAAATDAEAQAIADAAFDARARGFVSVEGTAEGDPGLRVGAQVELSGLGPRFDNTYLVVGTAHEWDLEHGYRTGFEAESAFWGTA